MNDTSDWIDITLPLDDKLISWKDEKAYQVKQYADIDGGDPVNCSLMKADLHAGTHIDAPLHFIGGGAAVDTIDLSLLVGKVYVVEIDAPLITRAHLEEARIPPVKKLLFKTRNHELYKKDRFSTDFTALALDGGQWVLERGIELVGIDYLSIEPFDNREFPVHKALLKASTVILEGLYLEHVTPGFYSLLALPMKLTGVEAAPVRAFLIPG